MRRDIFVVDIETVSDADAARRLLHAPDLSDTAARDALAAYFLQKTDGKNDFPRQPFHRVVAISYAHLVVEPGEEGIELVLRRVGSGGESTSDERELLEGFFGFIDKKAPQLVTFNGRGFDIPVLKYRAMAHGLSCPRWFSEGNRYDNYDARYSHEYHLDLLEAFSDFGASARCSLDEVAAAFNLPGKLATSGGDVRSLFESKRIDDIRNYCETDVVSTLLLYLRWLHFRGTLSQGALARALLGVRNYLLAEQEQRPHFAAFLAAWQLDNLAT